MPIGRGEIPANQGRLFSGDASVYDNNNVFVNTCCANLMLLLVHSNGRFPGSNGRTVRDMGTALSQNNSPWSYASL